MKSIHHDRRGIAHVVIILAVVAVVGVIGFVGWTVMQKGKDGDNIVSKAADSVADNAAKQVAKADCEKKNDKDLCKFITNWEITKQYRITSVDKQGTSIFEIDGDNKTRMKFTGETSFETITIDKTTYTKAGDVWYKQTAKETGQDKDSPDAIRDQFKDPEDESVPAEDKTVYKALGKEACGKLSCFKYEVIMPDDADVKQLIWFDDKDYMLRKSTTTHPETGTSEQTYEYSGVKISAPSPVKELGPDQYIVPGQSKPVSPAEADINAS